MLRFGRRSDSFTSPSEPMDHPKVLTLRSDVCPGVLSAGTGIGLEQQTATMRRSESQYLQCPIRATGDASEFHAGTLSECGASAVD